MFFQGITINNFLAIGEANIALHKRGLVLVQGVNHDDSSAKSNGAGKSALVDALCWCLFGSTARGTSGDDVINHTAKKDTMVEMTVVDDALTYTITRYRKHKKHKNALTLTMSDGFKVTDLTKGTEKLTQELVDKIVGCSLEVFEASIYAGQERMPDLPAMSDKTLKVLIEEAAGATVLEAAYETARVKRNELDAKRKVVSLEISSEGTKLQMMTEQLKTLKVSQEEHIKTVDVEIESWDRQHKKFSYNLESLKLSPAALKNADHLVDKAEATNEQIKSYQAQREAFEAANLEVSKKEYARDIAVQEVARTKGRVAIAERVLDEWRKNPTPQVCALCKRPHESADTEDALVKQLNAESRDWAEAAAKAEVCSEELAASATTRDSLKAQDITELLEILSNLRNELREVNAVKEQIRLAEAQVGEIQRKVADLRKSRVETPYKAMIEALVKDAGALMPIYEAAKTKLMDLNHQVDVMDGVVATFGPAGVRARILDNVTPFLNAQTSKYLSVLSDGHISANWSTLTTDAKGNMKERFTIDVESDTGGSSFKLLSGGEKRKVRVSTSLALQDLVATRATKPIELFIGDEIDHALDPAGIERLTSVLEEKAKGSGTVLVISHNDMSDFISQQIVVEKKGGVSTVKEIVS